MFFTYQKYRIIDKYHFRGGEWSEKACDRFADLSSLAQWKRLFAKVKGYKERVVGCGRSRREGSPIPSITIYDIIDNKVNINVQYTFKTVLVSVHKNLILSYHE